MHRRLAVLAVALGLVATAAPPAAAADSWEIPTSATITIKGHGHGHGRGMSQYGAQRAASKGESYRKIVRYYYPRTRWGTVRGSVRIWITGDLTNDVLVAARNGLTAGKTGGGRHWDLARAKPRASRWRIVPQGDRVSILQYRTGGWHQFRKVRGQLEFSAHGRPIRLYVDGGTARYRGILRSVPSPSTPGNRLTVNVLPLESYLRGVVPAEVIASTWPQQALRAQAVAARSYAAHQRAERSRHAFDLDDTPGDQVYEGFDREYPTTDRAVKATARRILTYRGRPAFTEFTASSGGWTVAGDEPYLVAQQDRWDSRRDPNHTWTVDFTDTELEREWPVGDLTHVDITGRDGHGQWGGRAGYVTLTGTEDTVTVTGAEFAARLHLRSPWLSLDSVRPSVRPSVRSSHS